MAGEPFVSPALANTMLYEMTHDDPLSGLIEREQDILELVAKGLTNREIGERLFLAEKTVKHYMTSVLQKLHVRSRVEDLEGIASCGIPGRPPQRHHRVATMIRQIGQSRQLVRRRPLAVLDG